MRPTKALKVVDSEKRKPNENHPPIIRQYRLIVYLFAPAKIS
jgi:hypothetical protein